MQERKEVADEKLVEARGTRQHPGRMEEQMKPAIKIGDRATMTIHDVAFGGEGVGRIGELVVFVPFVLVGEEVEVEVTEVKKRFARARLLRVGRPSSERTIPLCPY